MKVCPECQTRFSGNESFCPNDATPLVDARELSPGELTGLDLNAQIHLERLEFRDVLAERYQGKLRGADTPLRVTVFNEGFAPDSARIARFEGLRAGLGESLPAEILSLHSVDLRGEHRFIAEEAPAGISVAEALEQRKTLDWKVAIRLTCGVGRALDYLDEHGLVYQGLNAQTIFIRDLKNGQIQLGDWALSALSHPQRPLEVDADAPHRFFGYSAYLAPETIRDAADTDQRSMVYSLGMLLYQLIVGKPPFTSKSPEDSLKRHLHEKPLKLSIACGGAGLHPDLDEILDMMWVKAPERRFQKVAAAIAALSSLLDEAPNAVAPPLVAADAPVFKRAEVSAQPDQADSDSGDTGAVKTMMGMPALSMANLKAAAEAEAAAHAEQPLKTDSNDSPSQEESSEAPAPETPSIIIDDSLLHGDDEETPSIIIDDPELRGEADPAPVEDTNEVEETPGAAESSEQYDDAAEDDTAAGEDDTAGEEDAAVEEDAAGEEDTAEDDTAAEDDSEKEDSSKKSKKNKKNKRKKNKKNKTTDAKKSDADKDEIGADDGPADAISPEQSPDEEPEAVDEDQDEDEEVAEDHAADVEQAPPVDKRSHNALEIGFLETANDGGGEFAETWFGADADSAWDQSQIQEQMEYSENRQKYITYAIIGVTVAAILAFILVASLSQDDPSAEQEAAAAAEAAEAVKAEADLARNKDLRSAFDKAVADGHLIQPRRDSALTSLEQLKRYADGDALYTEAREIFVKKAIDAARKSESGDLKHAVNLAGYAKQFAKGDAEVEAYESQLSERLRSGGSVAPQQDDGAPAETDDEAAAVEPAASPASDSQSASNSAPSPAPAARPAPQRTVAQILAEAKSATQSDDLNLAAKLYREAIAASPSTASIHASLGEVLFNQAKFKDALVPQKKAVQLAGSNNNYANDLGKTHYRLKQYSAAKTQWENVLKRDPNNAAAKSFLKLLDGKL